MKFTIGVILILLFLQFILKIRVVKVSGKSMQPTFQTGDLLLTMRASKIKRYDCVVFKHKQKYFVKRIIGLPGETVQIQSPYTLINGLPLSEAYLRSDEKKSYRRLVHTLVQPKQYFVLGDNRRSSVDSRGIGPIRRETITSKVVLKIWSSRK